MMLSRLNINAAALYTRSLKDGLHPVAADQLRQRYGNFTQQPPVRAWETNNDDDSGYLLYQDPDGLWWKLSWSAGDYPGGGIEERTRLARPGNVTDWDDVEQFAPKAWKPDDRKTRGWDPL